jgi:hypothetical protein
VFEQKSSIILQWELFLTIHTFSFFFFNSDDSKESLIEIIYLTISRLLEKSSLNTEAGMLLDLDHKKRGEHIWEI